MIDIRNTRLIRLTPEKNHLPEDATEKHHAVLLPDFGLVFPNIGPISAENFGDAMDKGNSYELFQLQCAQPEASELSLTIDRSQLPCHDKVAFPNISTEDWYWTGTAHPSLSGFAYVVSFTYGSVYWYYQHNAGFVLPVLRVAPGQYSAFGIEG